MIVLLHGITATSATWEKVLPYLATRFTVIAPDLIGPRRLRQAARRLLARRLRQRRPRPDGRRWATTAPPSSATRSAAAWRCSWPTSSPSAASGWCWWPAAAWAARSARCLRAATLPGLGVRAAAAGQRPHPRRRPRRGRPPRPPRTARGHRHRGDGPRPRLARRPRGAPGVRPHRCARSSSRAASASTPATASTWPENVPVHAGLGRARPHHPAGPRAARPRARSLQPPRGLPGRRPLPARGRAAAIHRRAPWTSWTPPTRRTWSRSGGGRCCGTDAPQLAAYPTSATRSATESTIRDARNG